MGFKLPSWLTKLKELFASKPQDKEEDVNEGEVNREHEPHWGSKDAFTCSKEDCWCLAGKLPNHNPGIQLKGANAQILEAAYNQSLGTCLKNTSVQNFTIKQGGKGYKSAPTVEFTGGGGSGASAKSIVDKEGGALISITLTSGGSGYTSAPTISFTGGGHGCQTETDPRTGQLKCVTHNCAPCECEAHAIAHLKTVVDQLLEKGADVNTFDRSGITPLHYSAKHLNMEQVKLLLQHKADPGIVDVNGNSPLHYAAISAINWKPQACFMPPGLKPDNICKTCGHKHIMKMFKNGKKVASKKRGTNPPVMVCELQLKTSELVKKLEKSAKGCSKYQNNMGATALEIIEAEAIALGKKCKEEIKNQDSPGLWGGKSDECKSALESGSNKSDRLQTVVAKLFKK